MRKIGPCSVAVTITRLPHALTVDSIVYEVSESLFRGKVDILSLRFAGRSHPLAGSGLLRGNERCREPPMQQATETWLTSLAS